MECARCQELLRGRQGYNKQTGLAKGCALCGADKAGYSRRPGWRHLMAMRRKENLPTKICATCGRPFAWRKKWEKVWAEVRYCSKKCSAMRQRSGKV